jgi:hypothetical protein
MTPTTFRRLALAAFGLAWIAWILLLAFADDLAGVTS